MYIYTGMNARLVCALYASHVHCWFIGQLAKQPSGTWGYFSTGSLYMLEYWGRGKWEWRNVHFQTCTLCTYEYEHVIRILWSPSARIATKLLWNHLPQNWFPAQSIGNFLILKSSQRHWLHHFRMNQFLLSIILYDIRNCSVVKGLIPEPGTTGNFLYTTSEVLVVWNSPLNVSRL